MNFKNSIGLSIIVVLTMSISSCKKDEVSDPPIPNEEEVITTLIYTLAPIGGGTSITCTFRDLDGDGADEPVITVSDSLISNVEYTGTALLLNESASPTDTINAEIIDEDEEHQLFYVLDGLDAQVTYSDSDADGNPIGLVSILSTGSGASSGSLTVVLRHEPDKGASGVSDGDITNAGGETDIEATFDIVIQ